MEDKLQKKIIDAINFKSRKLKISMRDGKTTMLKAVTFSQLSKLLGGENAIKIERLREIKRQLVELVESGIVVELESEPSFYLLGEEFKEQIGNKTNVVGIEGYA